MKLRLTILLLLIINTTIYSQEKIQENDPKVGLVLSGGGAKGLAHIGALKIIDSLNIRVDYIAGTSMGAIIGSLYASGYKGKQIDSIFKKVDFNDIINDNLPRAAKTFYERENNEKYVVALPFKNFEVKLPSALSRGQNTFNLLSKLTMHVNVTNDFSKLPIPFFCIATDIENGQPVILDKGNLAQAIKASGAFPSLFQPVLIDNQLLIDGGVTNNYPIDELREKGMDIIIGVDVQDGLANRTDLSSAPEILFQINNFRTINDMKIKKQKTDVYIKPDITAFNVVSFNDGEQIIKNGEIATRLKIDELQEVALLQKQKPITVKVKKTPDSLYIHNVNIKGLKNYTKAYVTGKLKLRRDKKISYKKFISGTNNLVATNNFDSFTYKLEPTTINNIKGYNLNVEIKETKKTVALKFAVHYDNLYKSAFLANFTKKQFLSKSDVLSLDVILGDNVRYDFEYFVDKGFYWSYGFKSRYNEFENNIDASTLLSPSQITTSGVNMLGVKASDFTNQLFIQTQYKNDFALTLGLEHKHYKISTETILFSTNRRTIFDNSDYYSAYSNLKYDSFDNKHYPNEGIYFNSDFNFYFHSSDYKNTFSRFSIFKAEAGYAYSFSPKLSTNILAEVGTTINEKNDTSLNFILGGYANNFINNITSFYGYDYLSISSNSILKSTITIDYEILKKQHIIASANYANAKNNLFSTVDWFSLPDFSGYALGYGIETFLGPIEAKYTYSPESKRSHWFFNLGFWF